MNPKTLLPQGPMAGGLTMKLLVLLVAILLLASCSKALDRKPAPLAVKGVLDLTDWNFATNGPVSLTGEWAFYWGVHLTPGSFPIEEPGSQHGYMVVPDVWNGKNIGGNKLPGHGFATYRLTVLLGNHQSGLALKLLDMATSYSIFVNGRKLYSSGKPGNTPDNTMPGFVPQVVEFTPESNKLEIVCHVSNFHHRSGGAWETISLGLARDLRNTRETNLLVTAFLLGSILIMGLYHFGLFSFRTKDRSPLYFGLFCIMVAVRSLVTGERYINNLVPNIDWETVNKLEYLSFFLAVMFFSIFMRCLFPAEMSRKLVKLVIFISVFCSAIVAFFYANVYSHIMPWFQLFTVLMFCYGFYALILAIKNGRDGATVFFVGFMVLFLTAINDIMYSRQLIQSEYILPLGLFVFIFSQAFLLSKRFSGAFQTVEKQSQSLIESNIAYQDEIRARRQMEVQLKERERKYRLLADNITDNIWILDLNTLSFTYVSPSIEGITGYTDDETVGRQIQDVLLPSSLELATSFFENELAEDYKNTAPDRSPILELQQYHKNGSAVWTEITAKFVRDADGLPVEILGVTRDITHRKHLESQLRQAQKMEAVGTLAGGVAHDFNNIIQVINGYVEILLMGKNDGTPEYSKLKEIQIACGRAAKLVKQLLTFSRKVEIDRKYFDLNQEIKQSIDLLERIIPKMIDIELHSEPLLWTVKADPVQIEQILLNLGMNAADAMPEGGKLIFETANVTLDEDFSSKHSDINPGDYVVLTISDTGCGMAKETVEHIFEPFFTTKEVGKGTGLGLASVYGIVMSHNGYITCHSEVGQGAIFRIYLPCLERGDPEAVRKDNATSYKGGSETILLVDDENSIRDFASAVLQRAGYKVITAANGEEALELFTRGPGGVDLVVMDLGMPGMGGHKCLEELLRINSSAKVVISSGYSYREHVNKSMATGAAGYLGKPYRSAGLLQKVRAVLDGVK